MNFPPAIPPWFAGAAAVAVILSICLWAQLLRLLWRKGGQVRVDQFGLVDVFVGSTFLVWFAALIAHGFANPEEHEMTTKILIHGAVAFCVIVSGLAAFLRWRGIRLRAQFGVPRVVWWKVLLFAVALYVIAMPIVLAAGAIIQTFEAVPLKRQTLVNFFVECVRNGDHRAVFATVIAGGIVAPIAEEFLFRGYLYGVLKKYAGWIVALVVSALLFASIHLNAASLIPLFLLAAALTIAYEITGSILVNMAMHSLFNLTMFYALWQQAQTAP